MLLRLVLALLLASPASATTVTYQLFAPATCEGCDWIDAGGLFRIDSTRFDGGVFEATFNIHGESKNADAFAPRAFGDFGYSYEVNVFRLVVDPWFKPLDWLWTGSNNWPDWHVVPAGVWVDLGGPAYVGDRSTMTLISPVPVPPAGLLALAATCLLLALRRRAGMGAGCRT